MTSTPEHAAVTTQGRPSRGATFGDRRGLTTTGAVLLVLLIGGVGAAVDVVTGDGLRLVFAASFITASTLAALLVRRDRLVSAFVMAPLNYLLLALAGGTAESAGATGSFASQRAIDVLNARVLGAPVLVTAFAAALLVVLARALGSRRR